MKQCILMLLLTFSVAVIAQEEYQPYNDDLKFKVIDGNTVLGKEASVKALVIKYTMNSDEKIKLSIRNNPQLQEIKLFGASQEIVNFISELKMTNLTHLLLDDYKKQTLIIPAFPTLEHLSVDSEKLQSLSMENALLDKLNILSLETPELTDWKTAKHFPTLGLIDLTAPKLAYFPIESMPSIVQFAYYCSFNELPENLCSYKELVFISFENYVNVKAEDCFIQMVKNGNYSNLSVYDKIDGEKLFEVLSKDREDEE